MYARSSGAFRKFTVNQDITKYTRAKIIAKIGKVNGCVILFPTIQPGFVYRGSSFSSGDILPHQPGSGMIIPRLWIHQMNGKSSFTSDQG
jgi:hypothetical protein